MCLYTHSSASAFLLSGKEAPPPALPLLKLAWPSEKKRESFPLASEKQGDVTNFCDEKDVGALLDKKKIVRTCCSSARSVCAFSRLPFLVFLGDTHPGPALHRVTCSAHICIHLT